MPPHPGLPPHLGVAAHLLPNGILLLRASGEVDIESEPSLGQAIEQVPPDAPGVIVDMMAVDVMSAIGFRAVADAAAWLADRGQRLALTRCRPALLTALRHIGGAGVVELFDTIGGALASLAELPDTGAGELDRVRALARMLPGAMQTRPVIEGAMRVVRDRYDLADTDQAFELLRRVSQQHNVRLRTLAAAVLTVRPPDPGSARWFPGRLRQAPPSVTFAEPHRQWRDSRSAFLSDVLDNALACMRTDHGDLQLIDRVVGGLRLEVQRGLPREFVGLFAHVTDDSTRAAAVQSGHRVVVADVATSPAYAEPAARAAILAANGRAIQSTPLVAPDGHCHGMVSTLDGHPGRTPSPTEEAALDRIGREAGAWLAWHQRTVVLDVLEDVHDAARRAR